MISLPSRWHKAGAVVFLFAILCLIVEAAWPWRDQSVLTSLQSYTQSHLPPNDSTYSTSHDISSSETPKSPTDTIVIDVGIPNDIAGSEETLPKDSFFPSSGKPTSHDNESNGIPGVDPFEQDVVQFWSLFSRLLAEASPGCSPPTRRTRAPHISYNRTDRLTERPSLMGMHQNDLDEMTSAHSWFVDRINDESIVLPYKTDTRGIVMTAGGKYMPIAVVSLRMLRSTGSTLPVELWMLSQDEYEPEICEGYLRDMNVTCKVISDYFGTVPTRHEIKHFQVKILAILFSQFEDLLFLDSDAIPVEEPDKLFDTNPYLTHRLVLWPDYWASTASPLFYQIAGTGAPELWERPTIESGQLLVSKSEYGRTLLLTTYYNMLGPKYYYPLLGQGGPGEGDKDTFLEASRVFYRNPYVVKREPIAIGFKEDSGAFNADAMSQAHPYDDFQQNVLHQELGVDENKPRQMTIHTTVWKLNAPGLPYMDRTARMWNEKETMLELFGRDVEKEAFEHVVYTACDMNHAFKDWSYLKPDDPCEKMKKHYKTVFLGEDES